MGHLDRFGVGVFITIAAMVVGAFIGFVSYERGQTAIFTEMANYGCEKTIAVMQR